MWYENTVLYHIFPLGFCDAPRDNDGRTVDRINRLYEWIPHLQKLHIGAVYFSPVFASDHHGYDTRDYNKIDCRLGTNDAFAKVCDALHEAGMRVLLDGVFGHVGRGFWAFQDVLENREQSQYKDWFYVNFSGNSQYNDGLWYEGWEGHFELVKLNLENEEVVSHLFQAVEGWVSEFGVDGLRLDVAYSLPEQFMRRLHDFCKGLRADFFLLGEMIHGDYRRIVNPQMLDSATNYECYKGLYSSFQSLNLFEISYSLNRQFGPEDWTLYKGMHLATFADNHDVSRVASLLPEQQLFPLYSVLFTMPGIPCLYYGSEWGAKGEKQQGDWYLRPAFPAPEETELTCHIAKLCALKQERQVLSLGDFENITVQNKYWVFRRSWQGETIYTAVNAAAEPVTVPVGYQGAVTELLTGEESTSCGTVDLPAYGVKILLVKS